MITKILVGLALVSWLGGIYLYWQRHRPLPVPTAALRPENSGFPIGIAFPRLGLNLPVYPARLISPTWEYSDRGVSFWTDSALPGKKGNSVMYGHNWPNILGRLDEVKVGDEIEVSLASGEVVRFGVRDKRVVGAKQSEILDQTPVAQLTVYTCVGFADRKRLVVVATPIDSLLSSGPYTHHAVISMRVRAFRRVYIYHPLANSSMIAIMGNNVLVVPSFFAGRE